MSQAQYTLPQMYRHSKFLICLGISMDLPLSAPRILWWQQVSNRASLRPRLNLMYEPSHPSAR